MPVEAIGPEYDLRHFSCGEHGLDHWLRRWALHNEALGSTRTFLYSDQGEVLGFYALVVGSVTHEGAPDQVTKEMPRAFAIPLVILARLGVAESAQGQGLGHLLVADAVARTIEISNQAGVRALMVDALNDRTRHLYESCGFTRLDFDDEDYRLFLTLAVARASLDP